MFDLDGTTKAFIEQPQAFYQFGDQITCYADGNPKPSYQWKNILTGGNIYGDKLAVVKSNSSSKTLHYQCTAINEFGNASANISFTISDTGKFMKELSIYFLNCSLIYS